jgi:hypothetical protein
MNLDEIERRANAATPGPWGFSRYEQRYLLDEATDVVGEVAPGETGAAITVFAVASGALEDAAFIASARTDVPALIARVRELEAAQPTLAVQLQRIAPMWSHETKSWTMREAEDGPYTLWSAAAETIRATMWERDEMRRLVRELEAECDAYARSHLILKGIHGALADLRVEDKS